MTLSIKLIIGLGNPGQSFYLHRHSIGFRVLDHLAEIYKLSWQEKPHMSIASLVVPNATVYLVKPQTYMNSSGDILPFFTKKGIKAENIIVIHDELEKPFGKIVLRQGGSARGHNGLKSIISVIGDQFHRLCIGIGRPSEKKDVPAYVLSNFSESSTQVELLINQASSNLEAMLT